MRGHYRDVQEHDRRGSSAKDVEEGKRRLCPLLRMKIKYIELKTEFINKYNMKNPWR